MSNVQFNLLPDVKLKHLETQRTRNTVITAAVLIAGTSLAIFIVLLLSVFVVQKKQLNDANKEVAAASQQLKAVPDLNKVLTIQNQLTTLSSLHQNKHVSSRIFTYLPQVTPVGVTITNLSMDFTTDTMTITGSADSHRSVNSFISTLKATSFKVGTQDSDHTAFPSVVESSFSVTPHNSSYAITTTFDPQLFANNLSAVPKLKVPNLTSTRANDNTIFGGSAGAGSP